MDDDENVQKVASLESEGDRHRFEESKNPRVFFQQGLISSPTSALPFDINSQHIDPRLLRTHHSSQPTSPTAMHFSASSNYFSSNSMLMNISSSSSDNIHGMGSPSLSSSAMSSGSASRYDRNRGKVFRGKNMNLNLSSLKREDVSKNSPLCLSGLHFPEGIGLVIPQVTSHFFTTPPLTIIYLKC